MNMLHGKLRKENGFTLAETLVAVALIGLLCVVLGGGVIVIRDSSEKMTKTANAQILMSSIVSRTRTELQSASDPVAYTSDGTTLWSFVSNSGTAYSGLRIGFSDGFYPTDASAADIETGKAVPHTILVRYFTRDPVSRTDAYNVKTVTVNELKTPAIQPTELIPSAAITNGMIPSVSYRFDNGCFVLTVTIKDQNNSTVLASSGELKIYPAGVAAAAE
jgi:prepilin-type N-terminal cleavage/methylation domain-containing protein